MSSKTLKQTVENIESMVKDIAFEMKGEVREISVLLSLVHYPQQQL